MMSEHLCLALVSPPPLSPSTLPVVVIDMLVALMVSLIGAVVACDLDEGLEQKMCSRLQQPAE